MSTYKAICDRKLTNVNGVIFLSGDPSKFKLFAKSMKLKVVWAINKGN